MLRLASMMGLLVAIGCSSKDDGAGDTGSTGGGDPTDVCGTPQATADFDEVDFYWLKRSTVNFELYGDRSVLLKPFDAKSELTWPPLHM